MIAAEGWPSRPMALRCRSRSPVLMRSQVPERRQRL
jgi:hypothetical protein